MLGEASVVINTENLNVDSQEIVMVHFCPILLFSKKGQSKVSNNGMMTWAKDATPSVLVRFRT